MARGHCFGHQPTTMSSAPNNNKRKPSAADVEEDGAAPSSRPAPALRKDAAEHLNDGHHLPAPIWGHALDYLPYEEVRSALLLCKMVANEAVKYVLALNFTKSCQLDGPSARNRFPNVEVVNVSCLLLPPDANAETGPGIPGATRELCEETVDRVVAVLTVFPKLRAIKFTNSYWFRPSNAGVAKALVKNILGALKARMLPNSIESIDGLFGCMITLRRNGDCISNCICRDVCSYFPFGDIIHEDTGDVGYQGMFVCLDDLECYRILLQRPGGKDATRDLLMSGDKLFNYIKNELMYYRLWTKKDEGRALKEKLEKLGVFCEEGDEDTVPIQYLTKRTLNTLDGLIGLGFDPKFLAREDIYWLLSDVDEEREGREYRLIAKSTFDSLVSRGFDLYRKDVNVFDEKEEPALQKLLEND